MSLYGASHPSSSAHDGRKSFRLPPPAPTQRFRWVRFMLYRCRSGQGPWDDNRRTVIKCGCGGDEDEGGWLSVKIAVCVAILEIPMSKCRSYCCCLHCIRFFLYLCVSGCDWIVATTNTTNANTTTASTACLIKNTNSMRPRMILLLLHLLRSDNNSLAANGRWVAKEYCQIALVYTRRRHPPREPEL